MKKEEKILIEWAISLGFTKAGKCPDCKRGFNNHEFSKKDFIDLVKLARKRK